jgi:hypothetical protein
MSKQISAVLPDDVAEMLKREQNGRSVNVTIVEALRQYWTSKEVVVQTSTVNVYPVFGSIPADRKADAGA